MVSSNSHDHLNASCNGSRVATQGVDVHPFLKQDNPLSPIRLGEFGEPLVDRAYPTIEITDPGLLGNPRQHSVDERIVVRAPLAPPDDVEGNLHGALQLRDCLVEVEPLVRLETLGKHDDRAPLKAGCLGCPEQAAGLEDCYQPLFVEPFVAADDVAADGADAPE